jgi:multidrug efflux system membrane fusion protein
MKRNLVLLAAVLVGCHHSGPIEQPPQAVQTRRIAEASGAGNPRFSAVVMPDSEVPLTFRVPGYVVSLAQARGADGRQRAIAEGDRVRRGETLARIRVAEYEDRVRQAASQAEAAQAAARRAQLDFERASHLFESRSMTKPDYDAARAQLDASEAQLRAARAQTSEAEVALRDTTIAAPFDGDVVKKGIEPGTLVGSGLVAFVVADTETVKIVVGVPDTMIGSVRVGQPAEVAVDAYPNRTFRARVSRMASAADSKTRNFEVEIAIPNRDHSLKVGMIASLRLAGDAVGRAPAAAPLVPLEAIVERPGGGHGVFLVHKSNVGEVASLRPVELGEVEGNEIRVVSGLASGETVITAGATLLKDGQRVEVLQ